MLYTFESYCVFACCFPVWNSQLLCVYNDRLCEFHDVALDVSHVFVLTNQVLVFDVVTIVFVVAFASSVLHIPHSVPSICCQFR